MTDSTSDAAEREDTRYLLEIGLMALTAVENLLGERTPQAKADMKLIRQQYSDEQLAQGAMIVLTTLVGHAEDSSGIPVGVHVQQLRELLLATLDEGADRAS